MLRRSQFRACPLEPVLTLKVTIAQGQVVTNLSSDHGESLAGGVIPARMVHELHQAFKEVLCDQKCPLHGPPHTETLDIASRLMDVDPFGSLKLLLRTCPEGIIRLPSHTISPLPNAAVRCPPHPPPHNCSCITQLAGASGDMRSARKSPTALSQMHG